MSYIIRGQWGLNQKGQFQSDPWFLINNLKIIQRGFGKPPEGLKVVDAVPGVILPGLVNSHTHLELSHLKNKTVGGEGVHRFAANLMRQPACQITEIMRYAKSEIEKTLLKGTFFFTDIANNPEFILLIKDFLFKNQMSLYGIQFLELLGFRDPFDVKRLEMAYSFFNGEDDAAKSSVDDVYITPHSIYGSSPNIMRYVQRKNKRIVSIHALEDPEEKDLFYKKGKTFDFLNRIGQYIDYPELNQQNYVSYLKKYFSDVKKLLLVHLAFTEENTLTQIKHDLPQAAIVLCHRSNVFLGYKRTNWQSLIASSLPLLIGTDSTATCADLSVLDEVLSIIKEDKLPASLLWKAATSTAYDYFEIPQHKIPWFVFPGTTPDVSSLSGAQAVNLISPTN